MIVALKAHGFAAPAACSFSAACRAPARTRQHNAVAARMAIRFMVRTPFVSVHGWLRIGGRAVVRRLSGPSFRRAPQRGRAKAYTGAGPIPEEFLGARISVLGVPGTGVTGLR